MALPSKISILHHFLPLPNYYLFVKIKNFYIYSLRCAFGYLKNTLQVC